MKNSKRAKLTLNTETLRVLDRAALNQAAGGGTSGSLKCSWFSLCISARECPPTTRNR